EEGAPPEYVRALFDQYAYNYDQHVKQSLQYKVPELLRHALSEVISNTASSLDILDLGCGTGLCAPFFRDAAKYLVGVDISGNMLQIAASQNGYDKLAEDDIRHYLQTTKKQFDLILAADV